jgi:PAS domain S-box-containing protein
MKDNDKTNEQLIIELNELRSKVKEYQDSMQNQTSTERNYQRLIENIFDVIVELDTEGNFSYVSPQVIKMFGYNPEEMIGVSAFQQIHPDDLDMCLEHFENALFEKKIINFEYRALHKKGHYIYVAARGGLIEEEGQQKYIGIIRDISDKKQAEEKISKERKRAEFYLDLLGHDINNLNQAIVSYSELLSMEKELSDECRRYSINSLNQALAISELIAKVQKLSEMQKTEFELSDINLIQILNEAEKQVMQSYPDKEIEITRSLNEESLMTRGMELLYDAIYNILGNAVKFNKNEKIKIEINLNSSPDDDFWILEFKDNGKGVPDEAKKVIFNRFERGDWSVHGSGLGLTIVNEVITRCGGKIWVEDRVKGDISQGSNFVVRLPKVNTGGD